MSDPHTQDCVSPASKTRAVQNRKPIRCIVKLGGAAITHKGVFETVHVEKLTTTCQQLSKTMIRSCNARINMDWSTRDVPAKFPDPSELGEKQRDVDAFVVVHGAGSFGHFQASKSGVHRGGLETTLVKAGFVAARISVTKLNLDIVRALAIEGIPAVGVSPFSAGWCTQDRVLEQYNVSNLQGILDTGLIPVLHGDAVLDSNQGCTILSGDVVLRKLVQELKPAYAVFLTNVPGVFDRPPSEPDAVLLEEIVVHKDGSWEITKPKILCSITGIQTTTACHDTTGGMATKIAEAATIAISGVDVYIVEVGTEHAFDALKGNVQGGLCQSWVGTIVRASI